jgi:hypothetical protein
MILPALQPGIHKTLEHKHVDYMGSTKDITEKMHGFFRARQFV